jgi:prepilin-type N-terminal cleavage/methylation domain-containing protein
MRQAAAPKHEGGFTLIEVLVVVGILAVLLAIVLIAINPTKQFQNVRNTQRSANVTSILDGIYNDMINNAGVKAAALTNVTSLPMSLGKAPILAPTGTTFSSPNLTFTGLTANVVTSGNVIVTSCSQAADNGSWPVTSGTATTLVVTDAGGSATSATGCQITTAIDLCSALVPSDIGDLPTDPSSGSVTGGPTPCNAATTTYTTGYTVAQSSNRFTIAAPSAENGATISVLR